MNRSESDDKNDTDNESDIISDDTTITNIDNPDTEKAIIVYPIVELDNDTKNPIIVKGKKKQKNVKSSKKVKVIKKQ